MTSDSFKFGFYGDDMGANGSKACSDTSNWHHWVVSFDLATNLQKVFLDGKLLGSRKALGPHKGNSDLFIGSEPRLYMKGFLNGLMDEVCIYNRALSAEEVKQLAGSVSQSSGTTTATTNQGEQWISKNATYKISSVFGESLPSLLTESTKYRHDEFSFHTNDGKPGGWVTIDLGKPKRITRVFILNRKGSKQTHERANGISLYISADGKRQQKLWTATQGLPEWNVLLEKPIVGRFVTLQLPATSTQPLHLRKVMIYGSDSTSGITKSGPPKKLTAKEAAAKRLEAKKKLSGQHILRQIVGNYSGTENGSKKQQMTLQENGEGLLKNSTHSQKGKWQLVGGRVKFIFGNHSNSIHDPGEPMDWYSA